jgi:hypothetical protein
MKGGGGRGGGGEKGEVSTIAYSVISTGHPVQCFHLQGNFFAKRNKIYQETARNFVFSKEIRILRYL